MKRVYFVSGIDTDSGKSYATGILAAAWRREGTDVITQKFIQTGHKQGISEDIAVHRRLMGIDPLPEDLDYTTNPVRFSYPASPELAARIDGVELDLSVIDRSTATLLDSHDVVLIEGAGGLMVPLKGLYTTLDYIAERRLPVILVTTPKLGSVNHALLSLEACRGRGVEVDFVVYNRHPETSPEITDDTRLFLRGYLDKYFPECEFIEVPFVEI